MVCLSVAQDGGERIDRTVRLPGDRAAVRERTTTVAMHLLRRLLLARESSSAALRLFVALDLPAAARAALARFRDDAADPAVWRLLPEESFHVTLAFLGHRPPEDVDRIAAALRPAGAVGRRRSWRSATGCCCRRGARAC